MPSTCGFVFLGGLGGICPPQTRAVARVGKPALRVRRVVTGAPKGAARDARRASERASAQEPVFRVGRREMGRRRASPPLRARRSPRAPERASRGATGDQADAMRRRGGCHGRRGSAGRSHPEGKPRQGRAVTPWGTLRADARTSARRSGAGESRGGYPLLAWVANGVSYNTLHLAFG